MALIDCKECGNAISTQAKACPKCGAKPVKPVGVTGIIVAITVLVLIVKASWQSNEVNSQPPAAVADTPTRAPRVSDATKKEAMRELEQSMVRAAREEQRK